MSSTAAVFIYWGPQLVSSTAAVFIYWGQKLVNLVAGVIDVDGKEQQYV